MISHFTSWMSWEGGVDLVACTEPNLPIPNVIVHVARLVHTPVGSAPAGMVLFQPDPQGQPLLMGFVCSDPVVGAYFATHIFADTPFAAAPALLAAIEISISPSSVGAIVRIGDHEIRTQLSGLGDLHRIERAPSPMAPFIQQGLEAVASQAQLWFDGVEISVIVPPLGTSGGPAAVFAPTGLYAR